MKKSMPVWLAACAVAGLFSTSASAQKFDGLAATPQMGWNSWNTFACDINEQLIRDTADAMVKNGLKDAGYTYVNIDDCWSKKDRNSTGHLVANPSFAVNPMLYDVVGRTYRAGMRYNF